ncbi:High mobility group box domain containing protein [Parasponia andersonii]|uniref:High mobility group box domain containing protein n=1 Tax=Parasponia andersonii TaxID=3476 RepID=A0A2P5BBQ5_PARAD|nr:High mobility group box domain containing protein [Parasponia andersonii]
MGPRKVSSSKEVTGKQRLSGGKKKQCQFFDYLSKKYPDLKKKNPKRQGHEIRKEIGAMFKKLSPEDKMKCATEKVSRLVAGFGEEQKEAIRACGFGSFLNIKNPSVKGSLLSYLIENIDPIKGKINMNGKTYMLTTETLERVMQLRDGGEQKILGDDDELNPFREELIGDTGRITLAELVVELEKSEESDELFIIRFILVVIGSILMVTSISFVNIDYISILSIVKRIKRRNWTSHTPSFLMESIHKYKCGQTSRAGLHTFFCSVQLFYLDNVEWRS